MDKIVYTLVSQGGGVDGRDPTDVGGRIVAAGYDKEPLSQHPQAPWCQMVPQVVDMLSARRAALAKLNPVDKLALGLDKP